jgi:hypothetical protein
MKNKDQKKLDDYLRNMMGSFTKEELKETAELGLKNLGIKTNEIISTFDIK